MTKPTNDLCTQRRLRSVWTSADAQADLSLLWAHRSFCWVLSCCSSYELCSSNGLRVKNFSSSVDVDGRTNSPSERCKGAVLNCAMLEQRRQYSEGSGFLCFQTILNSLIKKMKTEFESKNKLIAK